MTPAASERRGAALFLLCAAQFMLVLDIAVVNVGLPSIQRALEFSSADLQLVVTAYGVTFGGLLLLGGRAADLRGRRRLFVGGLVVFTVASLGCGLAQSDTMLVLARALQGVGAALVSPAALSLLIAIFPEGDERSRALGIWAGVGAGGAAAGLLVGGVLTDAAGWRWIFLINVPVGVAAVLAARRLLPAGVGASAGRIDLPGAIAVTTGLMALVYGLGRGQHVGFTAGSTVALLAGAGALLAGFVAIERRAPEPLVNFAIFRARTLTGANLALGLGAGVFVAVTFFLTLYFQQVLGFSPIETGLAFLPISVLIAATAQVTSRLIARAGARRLMVAGAAALSAGVLLLSGISPGGSYLSDALPGMLAVAIAMGLVFPVGTVAGTAGVQPHEQGLASGILGTSQQLGPAVALAALATVASGITADAAGPPATALTDGFQIALLVGAAVAALAALGALALIRERDCEQELARRRRATRPPPILSAQASPCQPAIAHGVSAGSGSPARQIPIEGAPTNVL